MWKGRVEIVEIVGVLPVVQLNQVQHTDVEMTRGCLTKEYPIGIIVHPTLFVQRPQRRRYSPLFSLSVLTRA